MNKFYLLLLTIGFQTLLFAQKSNNINKAPGDTLYYEDFANQIPSGWRVVNLASNNNNWIWSNTAPGGQYSTIIGVLNSTTSANGYLCLPADLYNTPINTAGAVPMNTYVQSGSISLPVTNSIIISWTQALRYCCIQTTALVLEVSTDSINWSTYDANKGRGASTYGGNGERMSIDVSNTLANTSRFWLRFRSTGNSHYFWMIDDLLIEEGIGNALSIESFSIDFHDTASFSIPMYSEITSSQLGSVINDLSTTVILKNLGSNDVTGARVTIELFEDFPCTRSGTARGLLATAVDSSNRVYSTYQLDTLRDIFAPSFLTNVLSGGGYRLRITATSDSVNQTPLKAIKEYSFFYRDTVYAKDRGNFNQKWGPFNYVSGGNQGDVVGELFKISTSGLNVPTSLSIYVPNDTAMLGLLVAPSIYTFDENALTLDSAVGNAVASTPFSTTVSASMLDSWVTLPFFPPSSLPQGSYIASVEQISATNPNRYLVLGRDTSVEKFANNSSGFALLNDATPSWILTNRNSAIRLNFGGSGICDRTVDIEEIENKASFKLYPNPTNGLLNLDLGENRFQQLEIRNTLGALVYQNNITGQRMDLDLSHLEKGLYFISLIGENSREVKKVLIQ